MILIKKQVTNQAGSVISFNYYGCMDITMAEFVRVIAPRLQVITELEIMQHKLINQNFKIQFIIEEINVIDLADFISKYIGNVRNIIEDINANIKRVNCRMKSINKINNRKNEEFIIKNIDYKEYIFGNNNINNVIIKL